MSKTPHLDLCYACTVYVRCQTDKDEQSKRTLMSGICSLIKPLMMSLSTDFSYLRDFVRECFLFQIPSYFVTRGMQCGPRINKEPAALACASPCTNAAATI